MSCCNQDSEVKLIVGEKGADGFNGWTALCSIESDGERRVLKITGLTGGTGPQPSITNQYLGASGIVSSAAEAVDIRGAAGATGNTGAAGEKGWSAIYAVVSDGERRVLQIVDWVGGQGSKPSTTNQFLGAVGIVSTAAAAVDIRGPQGPAGSDAALPSQSGHNGKWLKTDGSNASWELLPSDLPAILNNTRRVLREKSDGSGAEWYSVLSAYVNIPMQSTGIHNSVLNTWNTLRNSTSTIYLKANLPNDNSIRKIFISASLSISSNSSDGNNEYVHFGIRNITSNASLTDEVISTAYRKNPTFQYVGSFLCTGQEIGIQWKHDTGQNAGAFLGGHISIMEIP